MGIVAAIIALTPAGREAASKTRSRYHCQIGWTNQAPKKASAKKMIGFPPRMANL